MNAIRLLFSSLSAWVDKKPLLGLLIIIIFAGSFSLVVYNAGKDFGEFIYSLK